MLRYFWFATGCLWLFTAIQRFLTEGYTDHAYIALAMAMALISPLAFREKRS